MHNATLIFQFQNSSSTITTALISPAAPPPRNLRACALLRRRLWHTWSRRRNSWIFRDVAKYQRVFGPRFSRSIKFSKCVHSLFSWLMSLLLFSIKNQLVSIKNKDRGPWEYFSRTIPIYIENIHHNNVHTNNTYYICIHECAHNFLGDVCKLTKLLHYYALPVLKNFFNAFCHWSSVPRRMQYNSLCGYSRVWVCCVRARVKSLENHFCFLLRLLGV